MIPKKIHYCWFGGNPLPELAVKCIESWKKFCPDYEIVEWNESNFDVTCCDYVKEAYEARKWAFVSDYARFKILCEHGGLYFDTDVEIIKPLDDILAKGSYMGRENASVTSVNPGLGFAATPGMQIYQEILQSYHSRHFREKDGSLNLKTIVDYTSEVFVKHGLQNTEEVQCVAGIYVYPQEFFCPMNYDTGKLTITPNTYSIHHYTASWYGGAENDALEWKRKLNRLLPRRMAAIMATLMAKIKHEGIPAAVKWMFKKR